MEQSEADAVAQAILWPDPRAREEAQRKKVLKAWWRRETRKIFWLMLIGLPVGAAVALYAGQDVIPGAAWGAIVGGVAGWLWVGWRWFGRRL